MNIFMLDSDVQKCAEYHCDVHLRKMLVESTQMLCSAYYYTNETHLAPYKLAHKNHPCTVWVRESLSNWIWLKKLCEALYNEYKYRYNKTHKSGEIAFNLPLPDLKDIGLTKRPQAMPLKYKEIDPVTAYRNYYKGEKSHLLKYTKRNFPEWLK